MTSNDTEQRVLKKRTRNISSLTEEQIQQKRHIDRKAQRAFRQRTRDRVANLEQELAELKDSSIQREAQLQHEIEALREDNRVLLRRLESIAYLATSSAHIDKEIDPRLYESHETHASISLVEDIQSPAPWHAAVPDATNTEAEASVASIHISHHSPQDTASHELQHDPEHPAPFMPLSQSEINCDVDQSFAIHQHDSPQVASDTAIISHDVRISPSEPHHFSEPRSNQAHSLSPPSVAAQTNKSTNAPSIHSPAGPLSIANITNSSPHSDLGYHPEKKDVFAVLPAHITPTCPLDQILLGFFTSQRELLTNGASLESVIGPPTPSAKAIVHTDMASSIHPVSKVMSEVMMTYPYVGKPEQLGLFYLMHLTMRWQISPTKENYQFMPTWLRPTVTQVTIPHAAWIDNVPWPGVRDLLVEYPEKYTYAHWTENFTQNVSVNWEFDTSDALLERDDDIVLHSIFEKHIRKLKSWTVSKGFATLFPDLMPAIYSRD